METSVTNAAALAPIEVHRHGTGEPRMAVLHGGPGAPGSVSILAGALAAFVGVLEPCQRRAGDVPLSVERHVADLAAVLPSPVALVGWSWGAMLALSFATARPQLVPSLVLVGCGTYGESARQAYARAMAGRLGVASHARAAALSEELAWAGEWAARLGASAW